MLESFTVTFSRRGKKQKFIPYFLFLSIHNLYFVSYYFQMWNLKIVDKAPKGQHFFNNYLAMYVAYEYRIEDFS